MTFKKLVKKSIAIGIVAVSLSSAVLSSVHASELGLENNITQVLSANDTNISEINKARDDLSSKNYMV